MKENTRQWNMCKYSCAAGDGEYSHMLQDHGLNESYNCENPEIVKSGRYPTKPIYEEDGSFTTVAELCQIWFRVFPYGYGGEEPTKQEKKEIEIIIEKALEVCKNCEFYKPR